MIRTLPVSPDTVSSVLKDVLRELITSGVLSGIGTAAMVRVTALIRDVRFTDDLDFADGAMQDTVRLLHYGGDGVPATKFMDTVSERLETILGRGLRGHAL